jgi:hypothetical protein
MYLWQYIRLAKKGSFCRSYIFIMSWVFLGDLFISGVNSRLFFLWTGVDLKGLEWTNGNFVGISWEKLGTFGVSNEGVIKIFGKFVGITWE